MRRERHWFYNRKARSANGGTESLFNFKQRPTPVEKIGKLLRLLASPQDHNCLGAARALDRLLKGHRTDFHHLADVVGMSWRDPDGVVVESPPPPPPKPLRPWQACAEELLRHPEILIKSDIIDEFDFLMNMSKAKYAPTAKQEKWINDIFHGGMTSLAGRLVELDFPPIAVLVALMPLLLPWSSGTRCHQPKCGA